MTIPGDPALALDLLSVLCVVTLRIAVAYAVCWLLARCATRPQHRFTLWMMYLIGSSAMWLVGLDGFVRRAAALRQLPDVSLPFSAAPAGVTVDVPNRIALTLASVTHVLFVVYGIALLLLAAGAVLKWMRLRQALGYRARASEPVEQTLHQISREVGVSCEVWILPGLGSPATTGIFRPAIYLPTYGQDDASALPSVLCHELEHIKRRDSLWDIVASACRALLFFHPLIHRAFALARFERELACDLAVVRRSPEIRDVYAETLLRIGWQSSTADNGQLAGIGFISNTSQLAARIRCILKGEPVHSLWSRRGRAVASALLFWVLLAGTPALLIVLRLALPTVHAESRDTALSTKALAARRRPATKPRATSAITTAGAITAPAPVTAALHEDRARPRFVVQNADEPMSNPVAEYAGDPGGGLAGRSPGRDSSSGRLGQTRPTIGESSPTGPWNPTAGTGSLTGSSGSPTSSAPTGTLACAPTVSSATSQARSHKAF